MYYSGYVRAVYARDYASGADQAFISQSVYSASKTVYFTSK